MGIIIYRLTGGQTDVITWCDDHLTIATPMSARVSSGLVIEILDYLQDSAVPADHAVRRDMLYARVEQWQQFMHPRERAQWVRAMGFEDRISTALVTVPPIP